MSVSMQVIYPITDETTFDYDYYFSTHMDVVGEHFGPHLERTLVTKGVADGPNTPPSIYAIATLVLYLFHDAALGPFISDENAALETVATTLLLQLILTFFFIAIGTMLQVILEHLGWGVMVLIATIAAEAITVGWALMLLKQGGDLPALMQVMTIVAGLSMLAFLAFYLRMMKTLEKTRAV